MSLVKSLGHALLGSMFISGGASTFINPEPRAVKVTAAGIPEAKQAAVVNGGIMAIAGTALAVGIAPKLAATVLIGMLLPTTFVGHPFWKEQDMAAQANQKVHFQKNLAMLGGLLLVLVEKGD